MTWWYQPCSIDGSTPAAEAERSKGPSAPSLHGMRGVKIVTPKVRRAPPDSEPGLDDAGRVQKWPRSWWCARDQPTSAAPEDVGVGRWSKTCLWCTPTHEVRPWWISLAGAGGEDEQRMLARIPSWLRRVQDVAQTTSRPSVMGTMPVWRMTRCSRAGRSPSPSTATSPGAVLPRGAPSTVISALASGNHVAHRSREPPNTTLGRRGAEHRHCHPGIMGRLTTSPAHAEVGQRWRFVPRRSQA